MPTITKIEAQKKNKSRSSIFIDGEFYKGVDNQVVVKLGLRKGKEVNENELKEMIDEEELSRAKNYVLRYLSYKPRTERELVLYLKRKEFSQLISDRVLERIKDLGFIDDISYARQYTQELINKGQDGTSKILNKLIKRGINPELAKNMIEELTTEDNEFQRALTLAEKKLPSYKKYEFLIQKKKINDFLIRKGFRFDAVNQALQEVFKNQSDF